MPDTDPDDTLGVIEVAAAVLVRNFELVRRRTPTPLLDRSEYLLLRTLDAIGPADICGLAAGLGLDPSTVGRQVAVMAGKELVSRQPSDTDRRRSIVSPTEAGLKAMAQVQAERLAGTASLLSGWSDEDLRLLADMFTRYNRAVAEQHHLMDAPPQAAVDALLPAR